MTEFKLLNDLAERPDENPLPAPFDPEYAANVLTDLANADDPGLDSLKAFPDNPVGKALLNAVAGNSPYLAQTMLKDLGFVQDLAVAGLQASLDGVLDVIEALTTGEAKTLAEAAMLYRNVQNFLRQCFQNNFDPDAAPPGLREALARAAGAESSAALEKKLVRTQVAVLDLFKATIFDPAENAE